MRLSLLYAIVLAAMPAAADEGAHAGGGTNATKTAVNFQHPRRDYAKAFGKWNMYIEQSLTDSKPELSRRAAAKLDEALNHVFAKLPLHATNALANINFYLLWGAASPLGGRASGMSYIRRGEPKNYPQLDPRWEHAIVIYSADNLLHLDELWTRKALTHELAHGWHIANWPDRHPPIYDAWRQSQEKALYREVKDYKGKTLSRGYAGKNQLEYFAELSAMYFVGGNYTPFDRQRLQIYDPIGYSMVETIWGLRSTP